MTIVRCMIATTLVLVTSIANHAQQIPPESALPEHSAAPADTPSEAVLPDKARAPTPTDTPGEQVLPGAINVADAAQASSTALPDGLRPWLRLELEGHTGIVRSLALDNDGGTLLSGGEDKNLHVWQRSNFTKTNWLHRRVIRWQINRGPRGRIYSIATHNGKVALAGHGATGRLGEIWIVNSDTGDLLRPLIDDDNGHQQVIQSLVWSRLTRDNRAMLASQDVEGRVMVWQADDSTGLWSGRTIIQHDTQTYGAELATQLKTMRGFVPLVFDSPDTIITPHFVGFSGDSPPRPRWHLKRTNIRSRESVTIDSVDHLGGIVDLDVDDSGQRVASVDATGKVVVWSFRADGTVERINAINPGARALFVDLSSDGTRLLLGTELAILVQGKPRSRLQLWGVQDAPKFLSEVYPKEHVLAGVLNTQHNEAIIAAGNGMEAYTIDAANTFATAAPRVLRAPVQPARRVTFVNQPNGYRLATGSSPSESGAIKLNRLFDLSAITLDGLGRVEDADVAPAQRQPDAWLIKEVTTPEGTRFQLFEGQNPRGVLPLKAELHGIPQVTSTITTRDNDGGWQSVAVVVGTSGRNSIYVYQADQSNPPRLLRQFRGHTGNVLSTSTSNDGQYLASGSADVTVRIWNLADVFSADESVNRWGVEFSLDDRHLIAQTVRDDGPLYFRGVRGGDRLVNITWADKGGNLESESAPATMLKQLTSLPFDTLVTFKFSRMGRARPAIQSFAAWHPLATLFVDETREWAFWTPAGYYDASFNGHQRFGWQINRGVSQLPDYFRAAQFRQSLERPDIMRRLLAAGSVSKAMRRTVSRIGPPPGEGAIVNQYLSKPKIQILTPEPGASIQSHVLKVRARITVPLGATLAPPRAFISAVPSIASRKVDSTTYEWDFRLPKDRTLRLEVIAATEAEAVDRVAIELKNNADQRDGLRKPRLHLLAIGVGNYRDPRIQSLDFAADSTQVISDVFRNHAKQLYRVTADQLIDHDATRPLWRIYARQAAERLLKDVSPDDLLVMYLCGHGLRDRRTNQWYFVTSDAKYNQLMNDQYSDCLSLEDLSLLAHVPCRKLAILDSCHSGAVQPVMRQDDLKSALRVLQDDLVLTFTASEGGEEAAEKRETRLGRFSTHFVNALQGDADSEGNGDGVVSLRETIEYVTKIVVAEAESEDMAQHPTASPHALIRDLDLPLTTVNNR